MESVYGPYAETLPHVMDSLVQSIEAFQERYLETYGESAYEHLIYRIKDSESMREKCRRNQLPETPNSALRELRDAIGLRVVCHFIDDIYALEQYFEDLPNVRIVQKKDYIRHVKPNGYRSVHLILSVEVPYEDVDGQNPGQYFAEVQLRTIAMDSWAALEHQMKYKKQLGDAHSAAHMALITQELKRCADELASCDISMQTIRNLIRQTPDA